MGLGDLGAALRLVAEHRDRAHFMDGQPEEVVARAEQALGVSFPPSYREFVRELGAGDIAGAEFYGVTSGEFESSSVPNGIWFTLQERADSGLPQPLVVIYSVGEGTLFALDTAQRDDDDESPVVAWVPGVSRSEDQLETIAPDFGTFFRETVGQAL